MTQQTLLFGTLLFQDSMARPKHLDNSSVDWSYPISPTYRPYALQDTRNVRKCYRSKRVSLALLEQRNVSTVNVTVFLHNTDKLTPGAVRIYLWRKKQGIEHLKHGMSGTDWVEWAPRAFRFNGAANSTLMSSDTFLAGKTYQIEWRTDVDVNHGSVGIVLGGTTIQAVDSANNVTDKITTSGSARVVCSSNAALVVTPYADPNNASMFNGSVSFSVVDPYDIRPTSVGTEEFLDMTCTTRTVTKGMAIASTQVNAMFESLQVVVMQPCSGVSVYVGPVQSNIGPTIGPVPA